MIRRVNFTGRKRIARNRVTIELVSGSPRTFHAKFDLSGYDFPLDAAVFLEATCAGSSHQTRFDCGTIGAITIPAERSLASVLGEEPFFNVKVVDQSGRIGC